MVIPIPNMPMPDGPLPPECVENAKRLKFSILGMIGSGAGRLVTAMLQDAIQQDLLAILNLFMSVVMGIFMLKDDEHLKVLYNFLAETICQQCAQECRHGMQCLMLFMMFTLINVVFDIISRLDQMSKMPYGFFLGSSIVAQAFAVYFSWQLFKQLRPTMEAAAANQMELGSAFSNLPMGARGGADPAQQRFLDETRENHPHPSGPETAQHVGGFQAFSGQGQRLGS
eukprot:TRINITY_DN34851_c0_g1_i1.p1 TRINITY_DN34851_c0_g1~~TRINITY_DN34851_c0_g1_i1.p1  ORF type:complete len:227 (-),score=45.18 TRINITY_DN34851_c0_g1_i1:85-765(-)